MIYIGDKKLKSCFLGDEKIQKVYRGDELLFAQKPSHHLPEGYTELEYVEATGKQYIRWNVYAYGYRVVAMDVEVSPENYNYNFWGGSASNAGWYLTYYPGSRQIQSCLGPATNSMQTISGIDIVGKRAAIRQDKINKTLSVNDETFEIKAGSNTSMIYAALFANIYTNTSNKETYSNPFRGKIYSAEISTQADGAINMHLIPCIQESTGIVGFYDILTNYFRKSTSGTDFVAGPAL